MEAADKRVAIVGFKDGQGGVEQFTFGHDDDVEPRSDVITTKNLSNQSFSPIPLDRAAKFFGGRDAEAAHGALIGKHEDGRETPMNPRAVFVDRLKLGAAPDALVRPEPGQVTRC
jgi:hypothetical protein